MPDPLSSPAMYQAFIYGLPEHYPSMRRSALVYIPSGTLFGRVEGMIVFDRGVALCVQEYLNFELGIIEGYGYEVSRAHIPPDAPDFRCYRVLPSDLSPQREALLVRLLPSSK